MSHTKKVCRYCKTEKICLTCQQKINCKVLTSCISCGGIYGRPLFTPISAGCVLIEYPYITVILETNKHNKLKGTLNDIGGKYDPDVDKTIIDTLYRETKEEVGILLFTDGTEPYVDIVKEDDNITYRCYLIDSTIKKRYISTSIVPENPVVKMKIEQFLTIDRKMLEPRLRAILKSKLNYKDQNGPFNMIQYMEELHRIHSQ